MAQSEAAPRREHGVVDIADGVLEALQGQLARRAEALDAGARHVGWKVALGIPGARGSTLFGFLTSGSRVAPGAAVPARGMGTIQIDCELAVQLGGPIRGRDRPQDVLAAVDRIAAALEVCDVGRPPDDLHGIVEANVFHRAFALGPGRPPVAGSFDGLVRVNGTSSERATMHDAADRILGLARALEAAGEHLARGDVLICGAICSSIVEPGDRAGAEVGGLGAVEVELERW